MKNFPRGSSKLFAVLYNWYNFELAVHASLHSDFKLFSLWLIFLIFFWNFFFFKFFSIQEPWDHCFFYPFNVHFCGFVKRKTNEKYFWFIEKMDKDSEDPKKVIEKFLWTKILSDSCQNGINFYFSQENSMKFFLIHTIHTSRMRFD